jgi:hypothetical protein
MKKIKNKSKKPNRKVVVSLCKLNTILNKNNQINQINN